MGQQKIGIQAPGPPWRDPGRNSASDPGLQVPNGGMATHLVTKRCDLGSLGVPGPASTPCGRAGGGRAAGGRAVAPTLTPLVSTHPPKIAIPLLGGTTTMEYMMRCYVAAQHMHTQAACNCFKTELLDDLLE